MDLLYDPATGRVIARRTDQGALSFRTPVPRDIDVESLAAVAHDGPMPIGAQINLDTHVLDRDPGYRPPPGWHIDEATWQLVRG